MEIYFAKDIQKIEENAKNSGMDGILLMEHAAMVLYEHVLTKCKEKQAERIVIVCGPGNNGGDGFALARLLSKHPQLKLCVVCDEMMEKMPREAAVFAHLVKEEGITILRKSDGPAIEHALHHANLIVDALFGIGLTREITGWYKELILMMNASRAVRIAVDIPSGLLADSGDIAGCCIQANETITFSFGKLGLFIKQGMTHSGNVWIKDITLPTAARENTEPLCTLLDEDYVRSLFPKRVPDSHKGSYGKGLLIGGSERMCGALALAAEAALRCGIGTLTLMMPRSAVTALAGNTREAMRILLDEEQGECLPCDIGSILKEYDVVAIGNGLGRGKGAENLVMQVLKSDRPCILDGDAIFLASKHMELLRRDSATILTPHPKEVSYLTGISIKEIKKNPLEALKTLERVCFGATIIMKDTKTMIFSENRRYLNVIGNDGLAKGGSGDVLCGMVLGWLAQTRNPSRAACLSVYLHAYCAECLRDQQSTHSILPRDLLEILPVSIRSLLEKH